MIDCICVETMRLSDQQTIATLVPSLELMGRAAEGVYRAAVWHGNIAIVAGSGNNGGDGFALACILQKENIPCTVFTLSRRLSPDSAYYAHLAEEAGVPILSFSPGCLAGFTTVVDCLLGTGFQGDVREHYRAAIHEINASHAYVISVDINSGMNGDTGDCVLAVKSDLTVTIGFVKNGLIAENAGRYMKHLTCVDIGIRLARAENKITANPAEANGETIFLCPPWLNMDIIHVEESPKM